MRRVALVLVMLVPALAVCLAACGGEDAATPTTAPPPPPVQHAAVDCAGPAVEADLPGDFPKVEGVTYTKSTSAGPSKIVDGYYEGRLEDAYRKFKAALRAAGYAVIFDEIEAQDSEVAYSGGDLDRSGFVALREDCVQRGRISVHITNRPA